MKTIKIVFLILGIVIAGISFYLISDTLTFIKRTSSTKGEVVDFVVSESDDEYYYYPVVSFMSPSGEMFDFVASSGSNPPVYLVGEEVEVLYLPSDPGSAKINTFFSLWGASLITGIFGLVFLLIGGGMSLVGILRNRKETYLRQNGKAVTAKYKEIEINESLDVNGRNPLRIVAHWINPSTKELHIFKSKNLWFDPSDYINGDDITVYIDERNPKKYFLDTSFLPKVN